MTFATSLKGLREEKNIRIKENSGSRRATRHKKVVNITGDGAFAMTCQELETALRYGLHPVTVVLDDKAWGMIKAGQVGLYNNPAGVDLSDIDYAEIAKGFGAYGEKVQNPADIGPALERAFASGRPAVIEIPVSFTPHPVFFLTSVVL